MNFLANSEVIFGSEPSLDGFYIRAVGAFVVAGLGTYGMNRWILSHHRDVVQSENPTSDEASLWAIDEAENIVFVADQERRLDDLLARLKDHPLTEEA